MEYRTSPFFFGRPSMSMVSNKTPSVPRHIFIPEDLPKISKMFDQLLNMYTNPKLYIDACVYHRDLFLH